MAKLTLLALATALCCSAQYGTRAKCQVVYDFTAGTTGTVNLSSCAIPANSTVWSVRITINPVVNPIVVTPTPLPSGTPQVLNAPVMVSAGFGTVSLTAIFPLTSALTLARVYPFTSPTNPALNTTLPIDASDPETWVLVARADSPIIVISGGTIDAGRVVMLVQWVTNLCRKDVCP